ncbi:MAG: hypothetical protein L0323_14535 [Planctomycetes bacterium]|nr:hypothetical protein [Planctomycetota bacterium]
MFRAIRLFPVLLAGLAPASGGQSVPSAAGEIDRVRQVAEALRGQVEAARRSAGAMRLSVNGEEIRVAAIERTLVYLLGRFYLERRIGDFFVADEVERRREKGQPVEHLGIGTGDVLAEIESAKRRIASGWVRRDRTGKPDCMGPIVDESGSEALFDRVFVPEDPDEWSETTIRALTSQGGRNFVDKTMEGLRKHRGKNPTEPMPAFYRTIFRRWITTALKAEARIRLASDGLPPDVVLTVNERPLLTSEAHLAVAQSATELDRERAMRWTVWATATRQALVETRVYLDDEEFATQGAIRGLEPPYKGSHHGPETIATVFKGFPSYELYREFFRLRLSFERKFQTEVTVDALARHCDRVRDFYEEATVDAQVILCAGLDMNSPDRAPKGPRAFDEARGRARLVVALLEEGASFEGLIDRFSEFFDTAAPGPSRGPFGPRDKNPLKRLLGESEFEELLRGYSIGEILFHDAPVGEAVGPFLGPYGYYVGRVIARSPGDRTYDFSSENWRNVVREDYLSRRFLEWSNEAVSRSTIKVR